MSGYVIEEIRRVEPVWAELVSLFESLHEHHVPLGEPPLVLDWQHRWRSHLGGPDERLTLLGKVDGQAVALMNTRIQRTAGMYREAYAFLEDAYVVPGHRGTGLAQEMLQRTEQWCAAGGIQHLRLSVLAANQLAVHFWEKTGFEPYMMIMNKELTAVSA